MNGLCEQFRTLPGYEWSISPTINIIATLTIGVQALSYCTVLYSRTGEFSSIISGISPFIRLRNGSELTMSGKITIRLGTDNVGASKTGCQNGSLACTLRE